MSADLPETQTPLDENSAAPSPQKKSKRLLRVALVLGALALGIAIIGASSDEEEQPTAMIAADTYEQDSVAPYDAPVQSAPTEEAATAEHEANAEQSEQDALAEKAAIAEQDAIAEREAIAEQDAIAEREAIAAANSKSEVASSRDESESGTSETSGEATHSGSDTRDSSHEANSEGEGESTAVRPPVRVPQDNAKLSNDMMKIHNDRMTGMNKSWGTSPSNSGSWGRPGF